MSKSWYDIDRNDAFGRTFARTGSYRKAIEARNREYGKATRSARRQARRSYDAPTGFWGGLKEALTVWGRTPKASTSHAERQRQIDAEVQAELAARGVKIRRVTDMRTGRVDYDRSGPFERAVRAMRGDNFASRAARAHAIHLAHEEQIAKSSRSLVARILGTPR